MKKNVAVLTKCAVIIFAIGFFIGWKTDQKKLPEKDFVICHSFIFDAGGYKTTYLNVIVHDEDYVMEELFEEIKEFHNHMNGEPDELVIGLYKVREDLQKGEPPFAERIFYKTK